MVAWPILSLWIAQNYEAAEAAAEAARAAAEAEDAEVSSHASMPHLSRRSPGASSASSF